MPNVGSGAYRPSSDHVTEPRARVVDVAYPKLIGPPFKGLSLLTIINHHNVGTVTNDENSPRRRDLVVSR